MNDPNSNTSSLTPKGIEHAGVIDFLGFDSKSSEVLMVMVERRPWQDVDGQLFQLQEKLNAYLSFALDGEMIEAYPQFRGKRLRILLECSEPPLETMLGFFQPLSDNLLNSVYPFWSVVIGNAEWMAMIVQRAPGG